MSDEPGAGRGRKILAWILIGLGGLSIVDLFSPFPIPTVGAAAVISGGVLLLAGVAILKLGDLNWRGLLGRRKEAGGERALRRSTVRLDPLLPVSVLKLAKERGGYLTISTVAIALGVGLDVAEAALEECVRRGAAAQDFDEAHTTVVYRFPEFLPPTPESGR